jgi:hypothetical protein
MFKPDFSDPDCIPKLLFPEVVKTFLPLGFLLGAVLGSYFPTLLTGATGAGATLPPPPDDMHMIYSFV